MDTCERSLIQGFWDTLWFPTTLESFTGCPCVRRVKRVKGIILGGGEGTEVGWTGVPSDQESALPHKSHELFHTIAFICFLTALRQKSEPKSSLLCSGVDHRNCIFLPLVWLNALTRFKWKNPSENENLPTNPHPHYSVHRHSNPHPDVNTHWHTHILYHAKHLPSFHQLR